MALTSISALELNRRLKAAAAYEAALAAGKTEDEALAAGRDAADKVYADYVASKVSF